MSPAPIALFVYNRPQHTRKTVEALLGNHLAAESEIFIFSDGPQDSEESRRAVAEVRRYLSEIRGFRKVNICERSTNLGLAGSIIRGVTEIVEKHGRIIVLEDDLITAPGFLQFMNQALERYKDEEKVMQVTGYMFDVDINVDTDAIFLPFISSWGWATWKRAWKQFQPNMDAYEILKRDKVLQYRFDLEGTCCFSNMLESQIKGKIDSWAIRWYLSVFMAGGLTLFPVRSLVQNIGFDGSGRHCGRNNGFSVSIKRNSKLCYGYSFSEISLNKDALEIVCRFMLSRQNMFKKIKYIVYRATRFLIVYQSKKKK